MTDQVDIPDGQRQLILMRHAKSDWADESLSDHDRPLNSRGRRDAPRMAHWLANQNLIPQLILVSSSERTKETVALMLDVWSVGPELIFSEDLYHASIGEILATVQRDGGNRSRLMVLAHNPGMTSLVSHFAGDFAEMATAAIAVFQFNCDSWSELHPGMPARLIKYMRPKGLH